MSANIGFIGTGVMGTALIKGILQAGTLTPDKIYVFDKDQRKAEELCRATGVKLAAGNDEVVEKSDYIILAVKPGYEKAALEACKAKFDGGKILVSILAGVPIKALKGILGGETGIVRIMPNTPALVGEGMTIISFDQNIHQEQKEFIKKLFESVGKTEELEERLMSEVIALTGSSPAYVFMFIEAMADAAVLSGIPRHMAYKLAAQAVLGSARMVLETGKHPGELKDQVCSPAGTTIEAVAALEKNGFRYAVIEAMNECTRRARDIGRQSS